MTVPTPGQRVVGLSLSFCIKDIAEGRVAVADVERIVANTAARTEEDWEAVRETYAQTYWRKDRAAALKALDELRGSGRIEQPRLANPDHAHSIKDGHWIPAGAQVPQAEPICLL